MDKNKPSACICRLHHVAIQTKSFEQAFRFYTELLDLTVVRPPFRFKNQRTLAWLDGGSVLIELYSVKDGINPELYSDHRLGTDHIAFEVADMSSILARLTENGINIIKEPFLPPTGDPNQPLVAFIEGPDGEEIELRQFS
jgi:glyoxylase I family protein